MAATINDLAAVDETVADGDFLALHNVSKSAGTKDQKLSITKLRDDAFLTRANTWTAAQTVQSPAAGTTALVGRGAASQTAPVVEVQTSTSARSLALMADRAIEFNNSSLTAGQTVSLGSRQGFLFLFSSSAGRSAMFASDGGGVTMMFGDSGRFTPTKDTGDRINVYQESNILTIQNGFGTSRSVGWLFIRGVA